MELENLLRRLFREELESALHGHLAAAERRILDALDEHFAEIKHDQKGPERLLKPSQVAELLQVDERSVRRMVAAGELPEPQRIGSRPRWRLCDLPGFGPNVYPSPNGSTERSRPCRPQPLSSQRREK